MKVAEKILGCFPPELLEAVDPKHRNHVAAGISKMLMWTNRALYKKVKLSDELDEETKAQVTVEIQAMYEKAKASHSRSHCCWHRHE